VGDTNIANQRIAIGRGLATIRGGKESNTGFLRLLVQKNTAELIANSGTGMFASITGKNLKEFKILVPPLAEQKRIVDVVSSVDAYIDALQQQADSAGATRDAVLHEMLSACSSDWSETTLDDLIDSGVVALGRGNVISKKDMEADPGPYPVYSSAQNNDGRIGSYNKYMFDEELITWSVDGGGHVFYRPHHKFSVTNIGGYLRILDETKFLYPFLASVLQELHSQHVFDWQNKAHPSVIRKLYNKIPIVPISQQKKVVEVVTAIDDAIQSTQQAIATAKAMRSGLLSDLLSGNHEIPASYDSLMGAA
jgi:restriction endonuclease S subunit